MEHVSTLELTALRHLIQAETRHELWVAAIDGFEFHQRLPPECSVPTGAKKIQIAGNRYASDDVAARRCEHREGETERTPAIEMRQYARIGAWFRLGWIEARERGDPGRSPPPLISAVSARNRCRSRSRHRSRLCSRQVGYISSCRS